MIVFVFDSIINPSFDHRIVLVFAAVFEIKQNMRSALSFGMEVIIVRHGHRASWVSDDWGVRWQKERPNDSPLSELGLQQARELGAHLAEKPPTKILSSPYFRTLQTAHEIAAATHVPISVEYGISEWTNSDKYHKDTLISGQVRLRLPLLPPFFLSLVRVCDRRD